MHSCPDITIKGLTPEIRQPSCSPHLNALSKYKVINVTAYATVQFVQVSEWQDWRIVSCTTKMWILNAVNIELGNGSDVLSSRETLCKKETSGIISN